MTMPDEHGDVHAPPPSTAPVIVEPIQAHQSRTIRAAWRVQIWSFIVAVAPDVISVLFYLLTNDERFYDFVSKWFPAPIRYAAMTALITYARKSIALRKVTVAPIAGTPAATYALPLISPSHTAPVRTKEDQP